MSTDVAGGHLRRRARIEAGTRRDGSRYAWDRRTWQRAEDTLKPLRDLVAERVHLEARIRVTVQEMRQAGASWTVIGDALGVSRSAACKRYGADELPL